MALVAFDHVNIRTVHLDRMTRWYADLLGVRVGDRPESPVPGVWLHLGDVGVLHLIEADPAPMVFAEEESLGMGQFPAAEAA